MRDSSLLSPPTPSERLLARFCTPPSMVESFTEHVDASAEYAELVSALPEIPHLVAGASVLDFGCGTGSHAVGMAKAGARSVVGLDINDSYLRLGAVLAEREQVQDRVLFRPDLTGEMNGTFDLVVSYNSMEHFADPAGVVRVMKTALRPNGRLLISFSPPWLSAYGAHMAYITPIPWVHLLFSERTLMRIRSRYRDDGATRFEEIEGGLNRMTVAKFQSLLRAERLDVEWMRLTPMKGLPLVTKLPGIRELFTTRVACSLRADHRS